jgi:hypothetical protein
MNRRTFAGMLVAGTTSPVLWRAAFAQPRSNARNIVLVHGLFADGSCWSEVIARLQAAGLNATAVQNPLTRLPEPSLQLSGCWHDRMARRFWSGIPFPG